MAIDIRATTECSLGDLISASISDDYVQGTGLIKTQGNCVINEIIAPAVGTTVTFSYTKNGLTRRIPRTLQVLSYFADPYRGRTDVQLGCKLTYLQDKSDPVDWETLRDDGENVEGYDKEDEEIIVVPINAMDVALKCVAELGIGSGGLSLTNRFSIPSFDLSGGYVNVLSDLLISENQCGYIGEGGSLQVFSLLGPSGSSSPIMDQSRIIDIAQIGIGQLPGDSVTVNYSTLKLKPPEAISQGDEEDEDEEQDNDNGGPRPGWDFNEVTNIFQVVVPYGPPDPAIYNITETTATRTTYGTVGSGDNVKRVKKSQVTTLTTQSAAVAGALIAQYLQNGIPFSGTDTVTKVTTETFSYNLDGIQTYHESVTTGSAYWVVGGFGLDFVFSPTDYVTINAAVNVPLEKTIEMGAKSGTHKNVVVSEYGTWFATLQGQQTIAASKDALSDSTKTADFINAGFDGYLRLLRTNQIIETNVSSNDAPSKQDINLSKNVADSSTSEVEPPDSENNYQTESSSEIELALGSEAAQLRIELSMPYAPDDIFSGPPGGPYTSFPSDAPLKARLFGIAQNRLLLGSRFGMNIQTAPEVMPSSPFSGFVVTVGSQSAMYATNGLSWTISNEGVIASTDALFWGGTGGSGPAWFPVAPGVSSTATPPVIIDTAPTSVVGTIPTVGATPQTALDAAFPTAVTDDGVFDEATEIFWVYNGTDWVNVGTIPGPTTTIGSVLPVWNETLILDAPVKTSISIESYPYSLHLESPVDLETQTRLDVLAIDPDVRPFLIPFDRFDAELF